MNDNLKAALSDAVKIDPANRPLAQMPDISGTLPETHDRMGIVLPDTTGDRMSVEPKNELPDSVKKFAEGLAKSGAEITDLAPKGPSAPLNTTILPSPAEARDR